MMLRYLSGIYEAPESELLTRMRAKYVMSVHPFNVLGRSL